MSQLYPGSYGGPVASASPETRADFLRKTYLHLAGAVAAFVALEAIFFRVLNVRAITASLLGSGFGWLLILLAFMGVTTLANRWAASGASRGLQYLGLSVYVLAEALIFIPLLTIADLYYPGAIGQAAMMTGVMFVGLTAFVFATGKDFSWMGGVLMVGGLAAAGLIVLSMIFGFSLGIIFVVAMIALASGYILYSTSNLLHRYEPGQHVAASLALFASVALLFWYVLRLVMSQRR